MSDYSLVSVPKNALLPPKAKPEFDATSKVTQDSLGLSCERTTWHDVPSLGQDEEAIFFWAARLAARAYTHQIKKTFLGVLGPGKQDDETKASLFIRPFGLQILELMNFGTLQQGDVCGEFYYTVEGGLLASKDAVPEKKGRLYFRWYRTENDEVFETEVRDFTPRIASWGGAWLGKKLYKLTQMNMHRFVMWRYHVWIQKHRQELLNEAMKRQASSEEPPCLPTDTEVFEAPVASGRVDQRLIEGLL